MFSSLLFMLTLCVQKSERALRNERDSSLFLICVNQTLVQTEKAFCSFPPSLHFARSLAFPFSLCRLSYRRLSLLLQRRPERTGGGEGNPGVSSIHALSRFPCASALSHFCLLSSHLCLSEPLQSSETPE